MMRLAAMVAVGRTRLVTFPAVPGTSGLRSIRKSCSEQFLATNRGVAVAWAQAVRRCPSILELRLNIRSLELVINSVITDI